MRHNPISIRRFHAYGRDCTICLGCLWKQKKFNQIVSNKNGIRAYINNIYSIGDYFFLDYTLKNRTRIAYDIEEIRVKLTDKKETKATNSQTIELNSGILHEQHT